MNKILKVGVTGTRQGMTPYQYDQVVEFFKRNPSIKELHHGDCVGVDVQVAIIAREQFGIKIVCHPPIKQDEFKANYYFDETLPPKSYLARDRDIVDAVEFLLVVPLEMEHQSKGGTWYTHDYAVKRNKPFKIIWPGERNVNKLKPYDPQAYVFKFNYTNGTSIVKAFETSDDMHKFMHNEGDNLLSFNPLDDVETACAEVDRLRQLILNHIEASNNDDSAGDTFGELCEEAQTWK